jgi:hypothetical protein
MTLVTSLVPDDRECRKPIARVGWPARDRLLGMRLVVSKAFAAYARGPDFKFELVLRTRFSPHSVGPAPQCKD